MDMTSSIVLFFQNFYQMFVDMSFYMVIGLILVGLIHQVLSEDWIPKQLGKKGFFSIFKASVFGIPLPICSCGVIPFAVFLKKSGASIGAIISFLISTPQTGVDSIIATYGMMGPVFAIFRPLAAFVSGIVGGGLIEAASNAWNLDIPSNPTPVTCSHCNPQKEEENCEHHQAEPPTKALDKKTTVASFLRNVFSYAFQEMIQDIALSFLVGVAIAAFITTIIPPNFFSNTMVGNSFLSGIVMIIIGLPMYICSTSSIPIAISLIIAGINPGAAFVFLYVGPATNIATIATLQKSLGKKVIILYLCVLVFMALALGFLLDWIFAWVGTDISQFLLEKHSHIIQSPYHIAIAIFFMLVLIWNLWRRFSSK
jgi:uncharacterized membrane protein YraQ (UPF0718 family)